MELRLIDSNFAQLAATTVTASSQDAAFPVSNVKNPIRSRVHRTSGYFVIATTNRKIDFSETAGGGSPLVATVATGVYTADTLEVAIKAALEAAGASTYTVTFSGATGLWSITSDGTQSYLWLSGANVANSIGPTLGMDVSADDIDVVTCLGSNVAIHTEEWILMDLGTTEELNSVALLFDLVAGSKLTPSAVVTIQANATDSWAAPAVSQVLTVDDTYGVATHFFPGGHSYRYWRLKIVDPTNPYLYVETSKIILGMGVELTQLPGVGFKEAKRDQSIVQKTAYGHRYADIYPVVRTLEFNYPGIPEADAARLEDAYRRNGKVLPVVVALDSGAETFDKDRFFIYGYMQEALEVAQVSGANFTVPMAIEEAV